MSVAIVTVNWNWWKLTQRCVAGMRKSQFKDVHMYLVDNGSSDGSVERLAGMGPDVTLIANPANSGWSGGNNIGIQRALADGHEFIFLLNNDALPGPRAIGNLLQAHNSVMSAGSKLAPILGGFERASNGRPGVVRSLTDPATGIPSWDPTLDPAKEPALIPTAFVHGAALFAHNNVFKRIGKFDEQFFLNFDETDWCFRARDAGHQLLVARDAIVIHDGSETIGGWGSPLNVYFYTRNRLLFAERHCTEEQRKALAQVHRAEEERHSRTNQRVLTAFRQGLADYAERRFGDCPDLIRQLNDPSSGQAQGQADAAPPRSVPETGRKTINALQQMVLNTGPGPLFEPDAEGSPLQATPAVRAIAYYLPQFHPIPENDAWWGKGFTEWTNVSKAVPRFVGHYQPRLPGELGFYDLRLRETLKRQAELATKYGVHGFCFHYYWFSGTKLLETPLRLLLESPDIELPFCINWANESWTRRWDGRNSDVLISQRYSPEDDLAFCEALIPALRDPRYIKINGRPLIMIYRPGIMPNARATLERWRNHLQAAGVGDPYLVMPQGFDDHDPRRYGFDAAAGFPPHRLGWSCLPFSPKHLLDERFRGTLHHYDHMVESAVKSPNEEYTLFPGVTPSWDNEARKPNNGVCFFGSTPKKYGAWLDDACARALRADNPDERIIFINAWNEWAEGAYLEPDRHFGYAYLAETARALNRIGAKAPETRPSRRKVLARP